ncbi:exported hypothetical protein [Candidatus Sulfopaludibacter sp. SbA3]|nr:exported hypothetical protein [Candidatus Sulfopaludibacter sp. SbA3]
MRILASAVLAAALASAQTDFREVLDQGAGGFRNAWYAEALVENQALYTAAHQSFERVLALSPVQCGRPGEQGSPLYAGGDRVAHVLSGSHDCPPGLGYEC